MAKVILRASREFIAEIFKSTDTNQRFWITDGIPPSSIFENFSVDDYGIVIFEFSDNSISGDVEVKPIYHREEVIRTDKIANQL